MKKITLFFILILVVSSVFAQDSYFVKAGFGAGISGASFKVFSADAYNNNKAVPSGQGQIGIGVIHGNWQLETGLGYLRTGVSFVKNEYEPLCGGGPNTNPVTILPVGPNVKYTIKNDHLVIPLIISYAMNKQNKFSFYPGAGIEASYNMQGTITSNASNPDGAILDPIQINYHYNTVSAMALLKCDAQYRINKMLSVWCSPTYQQMFTSLTSKVQGDYMSRTYDHAILLNFGVRYNLPSPVHTAVKGAAN